MKPNVFVPLSFLFLLSTAQAATVTKTTITQTSVTPTSAPAGTMFKFTAELNAPLTTGNKVKIDLGKGLASMTGTKTSYSLSRAIYTTGSQTYKVGIYNAKNVLQGKVSSGNYVVQSASPENHAPTLSLVKADATAITNTAYTVRLNAKDVDANLNSITMNWGDNSEPETLTATDSKDLVFSHIYTTADSFGWNAFANDKGTPVLKSKSVSKIITVSNPVITEVIDVPVQNTSGNKPTGIVYLNCDLQAAVDFSLKIDEASGNITVTRPSGSQNAVGFFSPTKISFQTPLTIYGHSDYEIDRSTLGIVFTGVIGDTKVETTGECVVINTSGNKI
ncbi:MAG: hypothetical protein WCI06_04820 [Methylococcaceae bacterium]